MNELWEPFRIVLGAGVIGVIGTLGVARAKEVADRKALLREAYMELLLALDHVATTSWEKWKASGQADATTQSLRKARFRVLLVENDEQRCIEVSQLVDLCIELLDLTVWIGNAPEPEDFLARQVEAHCEKAKVFERRLESFLLSIRRARLR